MEMKIIGYDEYLADYLDLVRLFDKTFSQFQNGTKEAREELSPYTEEQIKEKILEEMDCEEIEEGDGIALLFESLYQINGVEIHFIFDLKITEDGEHFIRYVGVN